MVKSFSEYKEYRLTQDLAESLISANIDIDQFCDMVMEITSQFDPESTLIINELIGGLGKIAGGIGRGLWQGAKAVGGAIGNVANKGLQAAGQGVQAMGNLYQQGEQEREINKIIQSVQQLQQRLLNMGFKSPQVAQLFEQLTKTLKLGLDQLAKNNSLRFGNNRQGQFSQGSLWNNVNQQNMQQRQQNQLQGAQAAASGGAGI